MQQLGLLSVVFVLVAVRLDIRTRPGLLCNAQTVQTGNLGNTQQDGARLTAWSPSVSVSLHLHTPGPDKGSLVSAIEPKERQRRQASGRRRNRNGSKKRNNRNKSGGGRSGASCLEVSGMDWRSYHSATVIYK